MHAPQWICLALIVMGLMVASHDHGKPKTGKNDIWTSIIATVITTSILYWGGFFSH